MKTHNGKDFGKIFVKSLKPLQKIFVLKPCWPKKGPTGGCIFASVAGIFKQTHQSNVQNDVDQIFELSAFCSKNKFAIFNHLVTNIFKIFKLVFFFFLS